MTDPRDIVAAGWDSAGDAYLAWSLACDWEPRRRFLAEFLKWLPPGSDVLEIGCGAGLPATQALAERFRVRALDVSAGQVERARRNVPAADFEVGDVMEIELPAQGFDGIAAFYSLTHIPRKDHPDLYARIASWLRPGGFFVASLGSRDNEGVVEEDWLGAPMFFSHFDAPTNRRLLVEAGFELVRDEVLAQPEHGEESRFLWVLARRM
jgi:cyclopropane fatty-acyl-phospholipid synthase-like methyltransferase